MSIKYYHASNIIISYIRSLMNNSMLYEKDYENSNIISETKKCVVSTF